MFDHLNEIPLILLPFKTLGKWTINIRACVLWIEWVMTTAALLAPPESAESLVDFKNIWAVIYKSLITIKWHSKKHAWIEMSAMLHDMLDNRKLRIR